MSKRRFTVDTPPLTKSEEILKILAATILVLLFPFIILVIIIKKLFRKVKFIKNTLEFISKPITYLTDMATKTNSDKSVWIEG